MRLGSDALRSAEMGQDALDLKPLCYGGIQRGERVDILPALKDGDS